MNKTEQKYIDLTNIIKGGLISSDDMKIVIAPSLFKLQNLFNNLATGSALANQYTSFNDYLLQELGRSKRRVMNILRIGKYMVKYEIQHETLFGIPLPKLELVAKHDIYNENILHMLKTHDYKTLSHILDEKKKEEEKNPNPDTKG